MATQNICRYNKFGYCKFGQVCRKQHCDELCGDSACDPSSCIKRHPKECKYFRNYNRCKFNPCKFVHTANANDEKIKELTEKVNKIEDNFNEKDDIELKINEINEKLKVLESLETSIMNKIEASKRFESDEELFKTVEKRVETFESNLMIMKKALSEKDSYIHTLENKIDIIVQENQEQNVKIEELVNEVKKISETTKPIKFKCKNCDFETISEKGLKMHTSKKHTKAKDQGKKYHCDHCKIMVSSKETLEVHIGKNHSEKFTCGLCENIFTSREHLETHLNTCEIYRCSKCEKKESTLPRMKDHVITEHDSEMYLMIDNFKISREDSEDMTWRDFYFQF